MEAATTLCAALLAFSALHTARVLSLGHSLMAQTDRNSDSGVRLRRSLIVRCCGQVTCGGFNKSALRRASTLRTNRTTSLRPTRAPNTPRRTPQVRMRTTRSRMRTSIPRMRTKSVFLVNVAPRQPNVIFNVHQPATRSLVRPTQRPAVLVKQPVSTQKPAVLVQVRTQAPQVIYIQTPPPASPRVIILQTPAPQRAVLMPFPLFFSGTPAPSPFGNNILLNILAQLNVIKVVTIRLTQPTVVTKMATVRAAVVVATVKSQPVTSLVTKITSVVTSAVKSVPPVVTSSVNSVTTMSSTQLPIAEETTPMDGGVDGAGMDLPIVKRDIESVTSQKTKIKITSVTSNSIQQPIAEQTTLLDEGRKREIAAEKEVVDFDYKQFYVKSTKFLWATGTKIISCLCHVKNSFIDNSYQKFKHLITHLQFLKFLT